jgi:hypothetical protein
MSTLDELAHLANEKAAAWAVADRAEQEHRQATEQADRQATEASNALAYAIVEALIDGSFKMTQEVFDGVIGAPDLASVYDGSEVEAEFERRGLMRHDQHENGDDYVWIGGYPDLFLVYWAQTLVFMP